jgi:hypothetical protein
MTTSIIAGSLACLAFASVAAVSTARQAGQRDHLSEADGLKALKLLLEQQASPLCIQRNDRKTGFCDLSEIMRVSEPAFQATTIDSVSLQLSDYTFRVTRSEDKQHFQASLTPSKRCGLAWFTDERKTIYAGKMQGC